MVPKLSWRLVGSIASLLLIACIMEKSVAEISSSGRLISEHLALGGDVSGVAVLLHGLNLHPGKMSAVTKLLNEVGVDVFQVSLRGHGKNFDSITGLEDKRARLEEFRTASLKVWLDETSFVYRVARKRADRLHVPLIISGFSFGALLGLDLLIVEQQPRIDKMVLFSPALQLRFYSKFFRLLRAFPKLLIPSASPRSYRSNTRTSIAAYNALYDANRLFLENLDARFNFPVLVIFDSADELVDVGKVLTLQEEQKWDKWQILLIEKQIGVKTNAYAHLTIDQDSIGAATWEEVSKSIGAFLSGTSPQGTD